MSVNDVHGNVHRDALDWHHADMDRLTNHAARVGKSAADLVSGIRMLRAILGLSHPLVLEGSSHRDIIEHLNDVEGWLRNVDGDLEHCRNIVTIATQIVKSRNNPTS